jgi:hypothetical protein
MNRKEAPLWGLLFSLDKYRPIPAQKYWAVVRREKGVKAAVQKLYGAAILILPKTGSPLEKGRTKGAGWMRRSRGTSIL